MRLKNNKKDTTMKEINRRKSVFGGTFIYIEEGTGDGCFLHAAIKVYDNPSEAYGLDGGKISVMTIDSIHADGCHAMVANYDRGWDVTPAHPDVKNFVENIKKQYN